MCGRFTLTTPSDEVASYFRVLVPDGWAPRYNIAPTQPVACVRGDGGAGRELATLRWGLIPYWAKDASIGNRMINARAETVAEKPAYKEPFRRRRCLIVADGFYEWRRLDERTKQPYFIAMKDRSPFGFAGIWDRWRPRDAAGVKAASTAFTDLPLDVDGRVQSCCLITTRPNELVAPIHDRMPVIVPPQCWDEWLDDATDDVEDLAAILEPFPAASMRAFPVSTHVNKPANDDAACIRPLPRPQVKRPEKPPSAAQRSLFEKEDPGPSG